MKIDYDVIDYWIDMVHEDIGLTDKERARETFYRLSDKELLQFFTYNMTGIFAYFISDDMKGGKILAELLFYIKPCYRGKLKLVKKFITMAEQKAKENGCDSIKIGANINYKDQSFLKLLKRWGYVDDTLQKVIN